MQQEDVYQSIRKMIRSGIPHVSFTPSITSQDLCYVQDLTPVALMAWIPPEPWTPGEPIGQQEKGPVVGHGCDPILKLAHKESIFFWTLLHSNNETTDMI